MPPLRLRPIAGARRGPDLSFPGPRVRIGRSRDNDVILPERTTPESSGHHAEALLDSSGTWSIVDLASSNGTKLNGVPVGRHEIKTGDRLAFGDEQFIVSVGPSWRGGVWIAGLVAIVLGAVVATAVWRGRARSPFEEVAGTAPRSVFAIVIEEGGRRSFVGTAFAVDADGLLATNAHIVGALRNRGALPASPGGNRALAVQSDSYDAREIVSASTHPSWRDGSIRSDVAVLRISSGPKLVPLRLAGAEAIAALRRGTPLAAFGFPAVSTDPLRPRGRLSVDVVGDVRGDYVEVGLGIAPGTSGSPVFDSNGTVIAIVVGGDFVDAPTGTRPTGSAANWAIRIGAFGELLAAGH